MNNTLETKYCHTSIIEWYGINQLATKESNTEKLWNNYFKIF